MRTINIYTVENSPAVLSVTEYHKFLTVAMNGKMVVSIWVEEDKDISKKVNVLIHTIRKGRDIPAGADYVGTVLTEDRQFAFHVYKEEI